MLVRIDPHAIPSLPLTHLGRNLHNSRNLLKEIPETLEERASHQCLYKRQEDPSSSTPNSTYPYFAKLPSYLSFFYLSVRVVLPNPPLESHLTDFFTANYLPWLALCGHYVNPFSHMFLSALVPPPPHVSIMCKSDVRVVDKPLPFLLF